MLFYELICIKNVLYLIFFTFICRLKMGCENYIAFIVNAHRIQFEAKAPEQEQRIAHACASYTAWNPELMEEIFNSDVDASSD